MTAIGTSSKIIYYEHRIHYNDDGSVKSNLFVKHRGNRDETTPITGTTFRLMRDRVASIQELGTLEEQIESQARTGTLSVYLQGRLSEETLQVSLKVSTLNFHTYACVIL